jgi:hypothetical protein
MNERYRPGYLHGMRAFLVLATVVVLAGCGGTTTSQKQTPTRQQPISVQRYTGAAAVREGRTICKHLPDGTLPQGDRSAKVAALRAYVQQAHPTSDVDAMLRGCLQSVNVG